MVKRIESLPVATSGFGDIRIATHGGTVLLRYEYAADGRDLIGGLRFNHVRAFRFRDELRSAGFCVESYDTVVEILDSEWMVSLCSKQPAGVDDLCDAMHFAVFLSNNGYLEVICESFLSLVPKEGLLGQENEFE